MFNLTKLATLNLEHLYKTPVEYKVVKKQVFRALNQSEKIILVRGYSLMGLVEIFYNAIIDLYSVVKKAEREYVIKIIDF